VAAAHALACGQALRLRAAQGDGASQRLSEAARAFAESLPAFGEDAPLDGVLAGLCADIRNRRWSLES